MGMFTFDLRCLRFIFPRFRMVRGLHSLILARIVSELLGTFECIACFVYSFRFEF